MSKTPKTTALARRTDLVPATEPGIALVLGGGGARGLAHIAMLEVFDELQVRPKVIAGTSIGAIFGAAYASGLTASQIRAHTEELLSRRIDMARQIFAARNEPIQKVLNLFQLRSALLNPLGLLDLVLPSRVAHTFEDLAIPFHAVAADFHTQAQVVFSTGALRPAVAASMALPALFAPVIDGDRALMDGGLVNPLPFDVVLDQAALSVAIDVSGAGRLDDERAPPSAFDAIVASLQILQHTIVREKLRATQPDILINVDVGQFHVLEFHKLEDVMTAAAPAKDALRAKLKRVLGAQTLVPEGDEARGEDQHRLIGRRGA